MQHKEAMSYQTGNGQAIRNEVLHPNFCSFAICLYEEITENCLISRERGLQYLSAGFWEMDPYSHGIACLP